MGSSANGQVARILYKEIVEGDKKKILAESNIADTGGGARDFRFGSFSQLTSVIRHMFPQTAQEQRKRNGIVTTIDVFKGKFHWYGSSNNLLSKDSFFEPPTDARPSEGRIVRVHEYPCFDTNLIPKGGAGNRVLVLLIQLEDDTVWPYFAEERSLRTKGAWDAVVANEIVQCLDAKRAQGRAVIGYRDFTNKQRYCNGK